ncbi:MAG TPA: Fe-S cluster assembly protein SufD [Paludibacteraceae bacterium]|nr:Fe-S cluster assembly protein SufD [Paludibacteraceae bacterium]
MNEQPYIELYQQASEAIKKHSATALNERRDDAFARFAAVGFPTSKEEDYLYCHVMDNLGLNFGLNVNRVTIPVDPANVFKCDVPGIQAHLYFILNDEFYTRSDANQTGLPDGAVMCSMIEASERYPHLLKQYLGKQIADKKDGFTAFNETFAQDGYFLYVPKNVVLDSAIQLVNIMRSDVDLMANGRNLIILEEGAQAKLLVCDHTMDSVSFFANRLTEIFIGENASFDYYSLENTHNETNNLSQIFVDQQANSRLITNLIGLNNGRTRNQVEIDLNGEGAETWLGGMLVSDCQQKTENFTIIRHNVPRCTSRELFKYVLNGSAEGAFSGRVVVKKDAQKTEAYQINRNICLTREAHMYSKPQLEIYADDVKCSHGATTGQLDEAALFYMQARGISAEEARMLLLLAFTSDVLVHIEIEALRDRLHLLVEKRLRGEESKCKGCHIC